MRTYLVPESATPAVQDGYAQILPIHAALLPDDHIVYFSGDQHDPGQFSNGLFDHARRYNVVTGHVTPCTPAPSISDLFCCGHAILGDGRLLIAGGTALFSPFQGAKQAWIFDPEHHTFQETTAMADGRWYPTLLTLGNGHVLAVSGLNAAGVDQNRQLEVFVPSRSSGRWTVRGMVSDAFGTLYPRLHLLPDGRVFFVTPPGTQCATWRDGDATTTPLCPPATDADAGFNSYTSVLLPLLHENQYAPRILVGNLPQPRVIDLSAASPAWADTGTRDVPIDAPYTTSTTPPRTNGMAVLLLTGEVLSLGGAETYGSEDHPVHALEIYRADTNAWLTMPVSTTVTRNYHSVALLLPDGRVWIAGSDKRCDWSFHNSADFSGQAEPTTPQETTTVGGVTTLVDNRELRVEIFEPWYVGRPDRPVFTMDADRVGLGSWLRLTLTQRVPVSRVAVLRAGSSTHGFDADQRYVGLPFVQRGRELYVRIPENGNLLPPGPYLVIVLAHVVDPVTGATVDVPSVGHWVMMQGVPTLSWLRSELDRFIPELVPVGDPAPDGDFQVIGDPAEVVMAVERVVERIGELRDFITTGERSTFTSLPKAVLDAVPIHPIDPALLALQASMYMGDTPTPAMPNMTAPATVATPAMPGMAMGDKPGGGG